MDDNTALPILQLSISNTAKVLDLPQSTLEQEMRRGDAPKFFTVGRRKYTTIELIREWQAAKIAEAASAA